MMNRGLAWMSCVMILASLCLAQGISPSVIGGSAPAGPRPADTVEEASVRMTDTAVAADVRSLTAGSNAFAFNLYAQLAQAKGNLFFSPGSIDIALAMTYTGARGATAEQMAKTLHLDLAGDKLGPAAAALMKELNNPPEIAGKKAYQLSVANALWGQKGYAFLPQFTANLKENFQAPLEQVDFGQAEQAAKTINDWVAGQTNDKIKDLVPAAALSSVTRLVLTNAVYFKSEWANQFKKGATKDAPFKPSPGESVDVPMMHQTSHVGYVENDDLQAIEMSYKGRVLSMVIFLPKKTDGLAAMEKTLTAASVDKWLKDVPREEVHIALPRFKTTSQFELGKTLTAMGMTDAFGGSADFSGMTGKRDVFISAVIHKAFVDVDENGTEAAAATAVMMAMSAMPGPRAEPKQFIADHPFVFLIRHNDTGEILFIGRVANPKE